MGEITTYCAETLTDDEIMDIADDIESEFDGESTEPFYSFTAAQLRAFYNRVNLSKEPRHDQ